MSTSSRYALILLIAFAAPTRGALAIDHVRDATQLAEQGDFSGALDSLDKAIREDADAAEAYYWRGRVHFCLGKIKPAVEDFDRYVTLRPKAESQQWERGIALYYAKEYDRGAKQFELYQTYHDNDVENSTWRYLCIAKDKGVEAARKSLLPIKNDTRVPMMAIYNLYKGEASPDDVLAEVKRGAPSEAELNARQFYAHLYMGLWYEAADKPDLAAKHIAFAKAHKIGHYMWNVADVHDQLRRAEKEQK